VCEVALIRKELRESAKEKEQESGSVDGDDDDESLQRSECGA
jgi:hypothetical protein